MRFEVAEDAGELAVRAATRIAAAARAAVAERGRFTLAVSGGSTPGRMFDDLAGQDLPWDRVELFQVDERIAPDSHPDRNAVALTARLVDLVPIPAANVHLMPIAAPSAVEPAALDPAAENPGAVLHAAARDYAATLARVTDGQGLDLVHLGLGDDGHTASWPPGDPVIELTGPDDPDVVVVGPFNGRLRMTLTPKAVNASRSILWLIDGASKAGVLRQLVAGDPGIPASAVRTDRAVLLATLAASGDR